MTGGKLVSVKWLADDGRIDEPFGKAPNGLITYTKNHHVTLQIMKAQGAVLGGSYDKATTDSGYVGYFGTFKINTERKVVQPMIT